MTENAVVDALDRVARFRGENLAAGIARLEHSVVGQDGASLASLLSLEFVTVELLRAAVMVKRAASQIDNIVHAAGVLLCLPELLDDGETIQAVSLAAGSTGKPFDLETTTRVAEFTFIDWKGGSESIRKQKLFKDFYQLAEATTTKRRYLYFLGAQHAPRVFASHSPCTKMLQKYAPLRDTFRQRYDAALTVREYYDAKNHLVSLQNLEVAAPHAATVFAKAEAPNECP